MEIKRVPISEVEVWDKNPRNVKTKDFERLKRQIQELGVYKPLICFRENGKYTTLGGNMRLRALKDLKLNEVDISLVKPKTEAEKIKYALSDNDRVGQYDEQALAELTFPHIEEINLEDYKIDVGQPISLKDVIEDYGPDLDGREDEVPEIDDSPAITKMGDLFTLGKHRLLCGDATKEEDVKRLMGGEKAEAVITSPPYWLGKDYEYQKDENEINQFTADSAVGIAFALDSSVARRLIINTGTGAKHRIEKGIPVEEMFLLDKWIYNLRQHGWLLRHTRIWVKRGSLPGTSPQPDMIDHHWEFISTFYNPKIKYTGQNRVGEGWALQGIWDDIVGERSTEGHGAAYPIEIPRRNIALYSDAENIILDPFLGSGTTLIACEKLNRICYGMEIEPKYCDVIITRYSNFTDIPEEEIRVTRQ